MIQKRGKLIALGGGVFFLILILLQNMDDSSNKDSFYENFSTTDRKLNLDKDKNKKKASLKAAEDELNVKAESFKVERNKKDKSFSLYREILEDKGHEVEETIVETDTVKKVSAETVQEQPRQEVEYRPTQPRVVYVEPEQEQEQENKPAKKTRRPRSSGASTASNTSISESYIKAEVLNSTTLDIDYLAPVTIRILEEGTLPNGKKVKKNTLVKGVPNNSQTRIDIYIPEYNLEVYTDVGIRGILLTDSEGLQKEVNELGETEAQTTVSVPVIGSVNFKSGKKRHNRKVELYQNQALLLKWRK